MMYSKQLFILCSCLLLNAMPGAAQTSADPEIERFYSPNAESARRNIYRLMPPRDLSSSKTTAEQQRLVALTERRGGSTNPIHVEDSSFMRYGGDRGSAYDHNNLWYSLNDEPLWFGSSYVSYDTMYSFHAPDLNTPWQTMVHQYSATERVVSATTANNRSLFTYDVQDRPVMRLYESFNTSTQTWGQVTRTFYLYDANGRRITDSIEVNSSGWQPTIKMEYSYNAAGYPTQNIQYLRVGSTWSPTYATNITYTATNLIETMALLSMDNGNWVMNNKDSMNYSGDMVVSKFNYNWMGSPGGSYQEEYRHLNAQNLPDSIFSRVQESAVSPWDTIITKIGYNSFDNPVTLERTFSDDDQRIFIINYYYEVFEPTSVQELRASKELWVYPNPAQDKLYINSLDLLGKEISVSIINALGQVVQRRIPPDDLMLELPIHDLRPGTYWLNVKADKDLYNASFIKN